MTAEPRVRVYVACSLDGFIAGPGGDLSWLPSDESFDQAGTALPSNNQSEGNLPLEFADFIDSVGAIVMGRTTFDTVMGFDVPWPYGDLPVLVATNRDLSFHPDTVHAVGGDMGEIITTALQVAEGGDVYLDGGSLIGQALNAQLVDELTITLVPIVLGAGHPLFVGINKRRNFRFTNPVAYGPGLIQIQARREP